MTSDTTAGATADITSEEAEGKLGEWIDALPSLLEELRTDLPADDFPFDFSTASLGPLEEVVLGNWDAGDEFDADSRLLTGAMMYLGETLLRTCGGSWGWHGEIDQPVICPDEELGLLPLAPFHLIHHAVQARTGEAFAVMDEHLREAVEAYQEQHPGWRPTLDDGPAPESPETLLEEWIRDIPLLMDRLQGDLLPDDFPFDRTPESLTALESCLLDFYDPAGGMDPDPGTHAGAGPGYVEAAMAYLGEVLLRTAGGHWGWHMKQVGDFEGQPVVCPDPDLGLRPVAPLLLISHALRVRTGSAFTEEIERLRRAIAEHRQETPGWEPVKTRAAQ
ncbi:hypothetical protein ACFQVC_09275 [Streptomyces monticola]|uniref:SMI1/KNR4 family protein n=1 Tax=Streptomyces monticola TaxID=2666263 RepID=A0ABW2JEE0_9ACTN